MTEADWLERPAPRKLLEHLDEQNQASERKLRLFAVACCRRVQQWFIAPSQYAAVEVLERFADGVSTAGELDATAEVRVLGEYEIRFGLDSGEDRDQSWTDAAFYAAEVLAQATSVDPPGRDNPRVIDRSHDIVTNTVDAAGSAAERSLPAQAAEREVLSALLRCIFGNPFRPVAFDPRWRTETAVALAAGIYEARAFDRLPILADALEEAGCDHPDVLTHCREPNGLHARGCWVVDGVLGKA